jgi:hypothetical protein
MAIIIANENGDWWGWTKNGDNGEPSTTLFVLDTDKVVDPSALEEIAEWAGIDLDYDDNEEPIIPDDFYTQVDESIFDGDKLQNLAWDLGSEYIIPIR